MDEKKIPVTINVLGFLEKIKEYILMVAMILAVLIYLSHYTKEVTDIAKWISYSVVVIGIVLLYFTRLRPQILRKRELDLRPTGNPDKFYFTTSPRTEDTFHFFASGYEQYLEWLRRPRSPLLYLTGSSGSGKSSLINAYLAPQLEKEKLPKTNVYVLRSYHDPLRMLYEVLKIEDPGSTEMNEKIVFDEISKASKMLAKNEQILIILDQFEEFFLLRNTTENSLPENEATDSLNELKNFFKRFLLNPPESVYILLSYRDDFQQLIDQLDLPARTEHVNFEQVNPLTFDHGSKFLQNCPGLEIPDEQLKLILKEAASIDSPIMVRPIVLNLLGIILQRMAVQQSIPKREGNLIRKYILSCLGKELKQERATVLKAMLTDFNTARPRPLDDLSKTSGLTVSQLDNQMIIMQHHGLVRCLDALETSQGKRKWQIAHDFIALQLEKVVYGIYKTFWQKAKPWLAPALLCILIIFTSSYYENRVNREKESAIEGIRKSGFIWINNLRTIGVRELDQFNDSIFQRNLPDFVRLQPDTLEIILSYETSDQFTSLNGLDKVNSLKNFKLNRAYRLKNLKGVEKLANLVSLDLTSCIGLENVDALKTQTNLTSLTLKYCDSLKNIDGIKGLPALTSLDLNTCYSLENIDGLKELPVVVNLNLSNCYNIKNIDGVKGLVTLKKLDLSYCNNFKTTEAFKDLRNLEELILSWCDSLQDIGGLRNLKKLKKLNLIGDSDLVAINGVEGLTNLKQLWLNGCKRLQNLDALHGLTNLNEVALAGCSGLENIDGLKGLTNVKELDLTSCYKLTEQQQKELKDALPGTKISFPPTSSSLIDFYKQIEELRKKTNKKKTTFTKKN